MISVSRDAFESVGGLDPTLPLFDRTEQTLRCVCDEFDRTPQQSENQRDYEVFEMVYEGTADSVVTIRISEIKDE